MQKASLSLEANPLEIHVHDFFTIEVRQSPNVSDGATTPNEELPTEKHQFSQFIQSAMILVQIVGDYVM